MLTGTKVRNKISGKEGIVVKHAGKYDLYKVRVEGDKVRDWSEENFEVIESPRKVLMMVPFESANDIIEDYEGVETLAVVQIP